MSYLFTEREWTTDLLESTWEFIDNLAKTKYKLTYNFPVLQVVNYEQLIEAMTYHGMPVGYDHWTYGRHYYEMMENYKKERMNLAYEMVINTKPMIMYLMEGNSMPLQCLVMAHAGPGHGSFFKENYLFEMHTPKYDILSFLRYAAEFVSKCKLKYGEDHVETLLDFAHMFSYVSVDTSPGVEELGSEIYYRRTLEELDSLDSQRSELYKAKNKIEEHKILQNRLHGTNLLSENGVYIEESNILKFFELYSPTLEVWQKELFRIVRLIAQYFYPQIRTKMMNEGWATYVHHTMMNDLLDQEKISTGSYLEMMKDHSNVVNQYPYHHPGYHGLNVYAIGLHMFQEIERIALEPDEQDKEIFPEIAGTATTKLEAFQICREVMQTYNDESFVLTWLGPKTVQKFKLFCYEYAHSLPGYGIGPPAKSYKITGTQEQGDLQAIRKQLSKERDFWLTQPDTKMIWRYGDGGYKNIFLVTEKRRLTQEDDEKIERLVDQLYLDFGTLLWPGPIEYRHES